MRHVRKADIAATLLASFLAFAGQGAAQDRRAATSVQSTIDVLHALVHAGKLSEMMAKVDGLGLGDPAWRRIMEVLTEAAENQGDYSFLKRKAREVLEASTDPKTRAAAAFALGIGCWRSAELPQAEAAFADVGKALPDSDLAQVATGNIHEIRHLGIGQPTPRFVLQTTDGASLSSDDLRGKVILLNFWAAG